MAARSVDHPAPPAICHDVVRSHVGGIVGVNAHGTETANRRDIVRSVYPLYVQKAAKKGRTKEEVDEIITWLTGYGGEQLRQAVCGVRVEEISDPLMQKIRYLDKLIDELAKGKKIASILRR